MLRDWPKAFRGDLDAQRSVAYMLSNPTAGVRDSAESGCGWRLFILENKAPGVNSGDADKAKLECGKLNSNKRAQADVIVLMLKEVV